MTALRFETRAARPRFGLKGPHAAAWLTGQGIAVPAMPNTWIGMTAGADDSLLVARLGSGEFFLEDRAGADMLSCIEPAAEAHPAGVYPVLRADAAFMLSGAGSLEVLAQVCNVDFAALRLDARPVVMTMMIGIAVLVLPYGDRRFLIWCDPTFGEYLGESLGKVVADGGGEVVIDRGGQQGD